MTPREQMIMCALRYCLYRRSYMPSVCRNELRREVEEGNLSQRAISQAIHEINEVERYFDDIKKYFDQKKKKKFDHDWYQKAEWLELRDWLREKLTEEKQIQWLKQKDDKS